MTSTVSEEQNRVVSKAFYRACHLLGLSNEQRSACLGRSPAASDDVEESGFRLNGQEELARAIDLIALYKSLYSLTGGDEATMLRFMTRSNTETKGIPIEQIQTATGLDKVLGFVQAMSH